MLREGEEKERTSLGGILGTRAQDRYSFTGSPCPGATLLEAKVDARGVYLEKGLLALVVER